jgi:phage terminase large subunit-like protein
MEQSVFKTSEKGLVLASGEVIDYAEALKDYEKIKEISPIDFHEPYGIQSEFLKCVEKIQLLCGGNRSGKTEIAVAKVLKQCLENPKQRWWVVGCTFQDSIAIQQSKFWSLLPKNKIKYGRYDQINGFTNRKLLLTNGSLIIFKSYDQQRESFQGDQVDGVLFDEECPYDIFQECKMRLIDRDGEMLISMTSLKGVTELIENLYEDSDIVESEYAKFVDEELPLISEKDGIKIFFLWTTKNPYIPQDRVEQEIKLMTRQEIKCRIYGLPINMTGRIYVMMNKHVHVTSIEEMPEGAYTIYNILDPHDRKPWAIGWIAVHSTGSAYVIDEYPNKPFTEMTYDDKTYEDYAAIIKNKERTIKDIFGVSRIHKRIIDPNFGNKTVQLHKRQGGQSSTTPVKQLQKLGLYFKDGIDSLEDGHLAVREWLFYDKAESGEVIVQPKLMFCDNCPNHITGMLKYSRPPALTAKGDDEKDKVNPFQKWKDFPDCHDMKTEILTDNGWKLFKDLRGERVATVNLDTMRIEYQRPTEYFEHDHDGDMVKIKSRSVDIVVTPNHRLVVGKQTHGKRDVSKRKTVMKLAKDLKPQQTLMVGSEGLKNTSKDKVWICDKYIEQELWAAFLGIYLSEGCATGTRGGKIQCPGRGYSIYVSQSKDSEWFDTIKTLLSELPFHFKYNGRAFVCSNKSLWQILRPLGHSGQKYFPKEVWKFRPEAMQEMWKFLVIGDGWYHKSNAHYCTVSERLADDVQRLLTLLGKASSKIEVNRNNPTKLVKAPKDGFKKQYWITEKNSKFASLCMSGQKKQEPLFKNVPYKGKVYCVSVSNKTIITRRGRSVSITGNCVRYGVMSGLRYEQPQRKEEEFKKAY